MKKIFVILLLLCSLYVVTSYFNHAGKVNGFASFPLDDAWIFWGFAQTFVQTGDFSINPQTPPGAGVTSPAYMLLLAVFIKLGFTNELLASLLLNCLLLMVTAFLIFAIIHHELKDNLIAFLLALIFVIDPRTAAIANSGMETLLFLVFQLLVFYMLQRERLSAVFLLIAVGFWVRPEIVILLPVILVLYRRMLKWIHLLYFLPVFCGYFIFLYVVTGSFWLNTGAAKYSFYSYVLRWEYLVNSLKYFINNAFPVVAVFFLIALAAIWKWRRHPFFLVIVLYFFGFWGAFTYYLPVLYHFGRYIFPILPVFLLIAAFATGKLLKYRFPYSRHIVCILLGVSIIFGVVNFNRGKGEFAYECRRFINRHITLSYWIKKNLPADAVIATHDIGAIGYISRRTIIDIVGLLDRRAVSLSDKPARLKAFLDQSKCQYIAVLDSWFVVLNAPLLFQTPATGKARFQVYRYTPETQVIRADVYDAMMTNRQH